MRGALRIIITIEIIIMIITIRIIILIIIIIGMIIRRTHWCRAC